MKVSIQKKHTPGTFFDSTRNCPLKKAISEQHPGFKVAYVYDGFLLDADGTQYDFDNSPENGYTRKNIYRLKNGELKEINIVLTENRSQTLGIDNYERQSI